MPPTDSLSLSQLQQGIHQLLRNWHVNRPVDDTIEHLLVTHQLAQKDSGSLTKAARQLLHEGLEELAVEQMRPVQVIRLHFLDGHKVSMVANQLNIAEATVHKDQKLAIDRLADWVREREVIARQTHTHCLIQRLERPSYNSLVGVDDALNELSLLLTTQGPPWLLSLDGLGGIGKTSMAHALASQAIQAAAFTDVGWVTARQQQLNLVGGVTDHTKPTLTVDALVKQLALQLTEQDPLVAALSTEQQLELLETRFRTTPHLVVVDNLETLKDVESLLPTLRQLATPTKFLLTSRRRYDTEPGLYHFQVPELDEANTLALVRQEAMERNLSYLIQANDDELHAIYATVGGNPLAIRLVVGQTHVHTLDAILDDLSGARGTSVENLYTYIYQRAWDALDEVARRVWLQMPLLVGRNANIQTLATYTKYEVDIVRQALSMLVNLSLVHSHGTLNERYYSIHNLTRTFLLEGIAKWT